MLKGWLPRYSWNGHRYLSSFIVTPIIIVELVCLCYQGNYITLPNWPFYSFLFHTLFLSSQLSQLSRNARMLTSFPPLSSEVREERGEVWEEEGERWGGSWRLYWLCWCWKLFLFFSPTACLASLCTFNNGFPVNTAVAVVPVKKKKMEICLS